MGTWLTMETLRGEALAGSPDLHGKLGNVMLAAPDIDLSVFKQQIARLDPSHFSVYVSKDDRALQVSASIQGDRRLGSLDPGIGPRSRPHRKLGIGVYDISDLGTNLIGHDNYTNAPQVVRQIGKRRGSDDTQAVIDAGADRTPRPRPGQIAGDLPPPDPATVVAAPATARERVIFRIVGFASGAPLPGSADARRHCRFSLDRKNRRRLLAWPASGVGESRFESCQGLSEMSVITPGVMLKSFRKRGCRRHAAPRQDGWRSRSRTDCASSPDAP